MKTTSACLAALLLFHLSATSKAGEKESAAGTLAAEVAGKGWIAYCARSEAGDWDLYLVRPDGTGVHPITRTPEWNEIWPRFSRDGSRILYRRLARGEVPDGNRYGAQGEPVVAASDGRGAHPIGKDGELPWATWNPGGTRVATLSREGIFIAEIPGGKKMGAFPRGGFFQQLVWSPDGKWLTGVSNAFATSWSIARMDAETGETNAVNTVDCCTPDWFPDSRKIVFSWRPPDPATGQSARWTQLWCAGAAGGSPRLIYAKDGRHTYGGCISPCGKYAVFTGNIEEDGDPGGGGSTMSLIRLSDTPIIEGESPGPRSAHPGARGGPILELPSGWEPDWTASEAPGKGSR